MNYSLWIIFHIRWTTCSSIISHIVIYFTRNAYLLIIYRWFAETFAEEPEAIVGGEPAGPAEFPHQASLRYYGQHICGASIIGPDKILTAAHCVEGQSPSTLQVATGTNSITGGQLHKIARIIVHPRYTGRQQDAWRNDVAVIKVNR